MGQGVGCQMLKAPEWKTLNPPSLNIQKTCPDSFRKCSSPGSMEILSSFKTGNSVGLPMNTPKALEVSAIVPNEARLECISRTRLTPARNPEAAFTFLFSASSSCASDTKLPNSVSLNVTSEFRAQHIPVEKKCRYLLLREVVKKKQIFNGQADRKVVDRPTQPICIWISICWVGGGDPCGVADFCFSGMNCRKKQSKSDFFYKISVSCT